MNATQKLEAAIASHIGDTGPITWTIDTLEDGEARLVATYSASNEMDEEPWTVFGGDAILSAAGFDRCNGGMDSYQDRFGDDLVCQWAIVNA